MEKTVRHIMGVPIHGLTMDQVLDVLDDAISAHRRTLLGVVNAAKIVNMRRDPELRESVLSADLILADGMSVVWASRLLRQPLPERIAGIDLMLRLLERGNERRYRVFCLGARQEVLEKVAQRIRAELPNLALVGYHHGYYTPEEEPAVASQIAAARPDLLFVAMTSPKKEQFLARWADEIDVPVCHGVGGSFDVYAGQVKRAPLLWQKLGIEWLYRVLQEPRRMWRRYLVTNLLFGGMLLGELAGLRRAPRAT
ncbi:MAG: WecB/TagA/CpsF family glycosyltransferase [Phycisphaerae bacterium]|nr:WecB/TagA/CpsF family glycosyltransferase [Phycisphaerae bacterium]